MIRQIFNKPRKFNMFETRQVDPMELFWDLIFVVALRYIIDSFVGEFTLYAFIIGLLVFLHAFIVWTNISVYSVNFYNTSHNNRLQMTFMLIPMLLVASITDYSLDSAVYLLAAALTITKLLQAYIWKSAIAEYKHDVAYQSLTALYEGEVIAYIICALVSASLFMVPHLLIPILILLMVIELFLPGFINRKLDVEYVFDRILIAERFLLFIILIFGEGFIGIVHIFQHSSGLGLEDIMRGVIIFTALYSMFLKVYDEYTIHKERVSTTFMMYLYTYVVASMLVISALIILGLNYGDVAMSNRLILFIAMIVFNGMYIRNGYRYLTKRKVHLLADDIKYYKWDIAISIIVIAITLPAIIFVDSPFILLAIIGLVLSASSAHIKIRAKIVSNIFEEDHEIVEYPSIN